MAFLVIATGIFYNDFVTKPKYEKFCKEKGLMFDGVEYGKVLCSETHKKPILLKTSYYYDKEEVYANE